MNLLDIIIILLLLMCAIIGFKRGAIKEIVSLVGLIVVFIVSFSLKGVLGNLLCKWLPFFDFAGNLSGVAMEFKMWGIDQLWTAKERKFRRTLYERLKILLHLLQYRYTNNIELINEVKINFYKNLPENMAQDYDIAKNLSGIVSLRTLLSNISIVEDVDKEIEQIKDERAEEADTYGFNNNDNLNGGDEDAEAEE